MFFAGVLVSYLVVSLKNASSILLITGVVDMLLTVYMFIIVCTCLAQLKIQSLSFLIYYHYINLVLLLLIAGLLYDLSYV